MSSNSIEYFIQSFLLLIFRSLFVTFKEEAVHKGIKTYVYSSPDDVMAGMEDNPDNQCFCVNEKEDQCRLNGIFDMSECQNDIPLIVSLPHFLGADKRITDRIIGLKPDSRIHRPVIHVEPVCLSQHFSLQSLLFSI